MGEQEKITFELRGVAASAALPGASIALTDCAVGDAPGAAGAASPAPIVASGTAVTTAPLETVGVP